MTRRHATDWSALPAFMKAVAVVRRLGFINFPNIRCNVIHVLGNNLDDLKYLLGQTYPKAGYIVTWVSSEGKQLTASVPIGELPVEPEGPLPKIEQVQPSDVGKWIRACTNAGDCLTEA